MPTYNVIVNSNFCTTETAGNDVNDKSYYIDWTSVLPQGEYELSFSFISEGNIINTFPSLPLINIDFLGQANIEAVQPSYQGTSSQILGCLYPTQFHQATDYVFFRAEKYSNAPVFLVNRPYNSNFRVQILNNANPPIPWVDQAAVPVSINSYIMTLSFKLLKLRE